MEKKEDSKEFKRETGEQTNSEVNYQRTLMRSIPASILSCSTSFLAWAILLVVDILIHQHTPTPKKTE